MTGRVLRERETGIEPATPSLARRCSTAEPLAHIVTGLHLYIEGMKLIVSVSHAQSHKKQLRIIRQAGDGNRTHVSSLEGWCSTIELHPHIW